MSTPWYRFPWVPFDLESTGVDVESDHVVTGTVARLAEDAEPAITNYLAAVEIDIPEGAAAVHGVTTEHAREHGKPPVEVLDAIAASLAEPMAADIPIVGMNLAYDFTLLDRNLRRYGLRTLPERLGRAIGPVIDVAVIDKRIDKFRKGGRKLIDLCGHYTVRIDGAHDAEFDAMAAARVGFRIGQRARMNLPGLCKVYSERRYPAENARLVMGLVDVTAWQLHEQQIGWYAEQATGLAAHWRREAEQIEHNVRGSSEAGVRAEAKERAEELRARADGVSTEWPMRPYVALGVDRG